MKDKITSVIRQHMPELIEIRRHIHQNPELSFEEYETMAFISEKLKSYGIEHREGVAKTGITGTLGNQPQPCVALRADIDALPMFEKTEADYASRNEGVMHACGHDVHTTCLIGATIALKAIEDEIPGVVKFIFQPGEEKLPGGALEIIKAGALSEDPKPEAIFGLHVHPPLKVGTLGFKPGFYMASADELNIIFKGKGGHAAVPRDFVDPIMAAASFLMQVQQVVSRKADPAIPTVVSFGHIETKGGIYNIIPEEVVLKGTLRTMNEEWRAEAREHIKNLANHVAAGLGCEADVFINIGYPCLINDDQMNSELKTYATELIGDDQVIDLPFRMSAEDFAHYLQKIPGVFFRLGVGNPDRGITAPIHSPYFDVDEEAIFTGASAMAWFAYSHLSSR